MRGEMRVKGVVGVTCGKGRKEWAAHTLTFPLHRNCV